MHMKTINISDALHKELKSIAAIKGRKIREVVDTAIKEYINRNDDADIIVTTKDGKIIKEYY